MGCEARARRPYNFVLAGTPASVRWSCAFWTQLISRCTLARCASDNTSLLPLLTPPLLHVPNCPRPHVHVPGAHAASCSSHPAQPAALPAGFVISSWGFVCNVSPLPSSPLIASLTQLSQVRWLRLLGRSALRTLRDHVRPTNSSQLVNLPDTVSTISLAALHASHFRCHMRTVICDVRTM